MDSSTNTQSSYNDNIDSSTEATTINIMSSTVSNKATLENSSQSTTSHTKQQFEELNERFDFFFEKHTKRIDK